MQQFDARSNQLIQSQASPAKWYYCICICSTCEMYGREAAQGTASMEWRTLSMRSTPSAQSSRRWDFFEHFSFRSFHCFLYCCHGSQVSNFLWPFKLSSPKGGFINKRFKLSPSVFLPNSASQRSSARKIWLRPRFLWSSWWWLGQPWGAHQWSPKAHELSSWMKRTWDLASRQKKGKGSCGFWF